MFNSTYFQYNTIISTVKKLSIIHNQFTTRSTQNTIIISDIKAKSTTSINTSKSINSINQIKQITNLNTRSLNNKQVQVSSKLYKTTRYAKDFKSAKKEQNSSIYKSNFTYIIYSIYQSKHYNKLKYPKRYYKKEKNIIEYKLNNIDGYPNT